MISHLPSYGQAVQSSAAARWHLVHLDRDRGRLESSHATQRDADESYHRRADAGACVALVEVNGRGGITLRQIAGMTWQDFRREQRYSHACRRAIEQGVVWASQC